MATGDRPRKRKAKGFLSKHPNKVDIEMGRLAGVSADKLASRFNVTRDAIYRHMETLTPEYRASLVLDVPREELAKRAAEENGLLLDHFKLARNIAEQQLLIAKACNDSYAVASLTRAVLEADREIGKFTGEIERSAASVTIRSSVAIFSSPEFGKLEAGLVRIARRYPEAKSDLLALMRELKQPDEPPMIEGERAVA
ncbi:HTH domain-containing protein [Methylobacterium sp. J-026]|uniref:HTH domain-containing protein n=1 Tax=Methylobacterium sp. J-026 TaxID=2836624 RepID=UPI001FBB9787|nr:HTH domain-containing protein [Methylobacterium sp. J-026]MCJ2136205.1 HTH domain-containing protein [Methylobacterium sp. J-026]